MQKCSTAGKNYAYNQTKQKEQLSCLHADRNVMEGWEKCSRQRRSTESFFHSHPPPEQVVSISAAVPPRSTSPKWHRLQATRQLLQTNVVQDLQWCLAQKQCPALVFFYLDALMSQMDLCESKMFVNQFEPNPKSLKFCVYVQICVQYTVFKRYLYCYNSKP